MGAKLTEWLTGKIEAYGTQAKLAEKIGVDASVFSRGYRRGTFSLATLARLSIETGEPALNLLRWSGSDDVADLIEQLYGTSPARLPRLARDVAALLAEHPDHDLSLMIERSYATFQSNGLLPKRPVPSSDETRPAAKAIPSTRGRDEASRDGSRAPRKSGRKPDTYGA